MVVGDKTWLKDKSLVWMRDCRYSNNENVKHVWFSIIRIDKRMSHNTNLFERVRGIEPLSHPWKGRVEPFNYTRIYDLWNFTWATK